MRLIILFRGYYKGNWLFPVRFYLATILNCRDPIRTLFNYPYCFFFHTMLMICQCFHITDLSFFINDELNRNSISSFIGTIFNRHVRIKISFKILAPCSFTTFKAGFHFYFLKYFILIFLFLFFDNRFTLINYGRSKTFIFNTFLAYNVNLSVFQFFYFRWNFFFFYFLIFYNFRRSKLCHFHFWRLLFWRWRRRGLRFF